MKGFKTNIEKETLDNTNFREVLYTGEHLQLVLMCLNPGEDIGAETHTTIDQFFRFESGKGKCIINEFEYLVKEGDVIIVPAGSKHNVINTESNSALKLYTLYSPPNHEDAIVRNTKADAANNKEEFNGITTE